MAGGTVFLLGHPGFWITSTPTDEEGFFQIENVEDGTYEIVALTGKIPDVWEAFRLVRSHPNRESIEVNGADVERPFYFTRFGNLAGRVVPPPQREWELRLRGAAPDQPHDRRLEMAADGTFLFDGLPPGAYRLDYKPKYNKASLAKPLVDEVHMPGDGSDVDLGEIAKPEDPGTLLIILEGSVPKQEMDFRVELFPTSGDPDDHHQVISSGNVRRDGRRIFLENLPVGPVQCKVTHTRGGYLIIPSLVPVEIFPGTTSEIQVFIKAVTELYLYCSKGRETWSNVTLLHEDGTSLELPLLTGAEPTDDTDGVIAYFSDRFGRAKNLAPGVWRVTVVSKSGKTWNGETSLDIGKPASLQVSFE